MKRIIPIFILHQSYILGSSVVTSLVTPLIKRIIAKVNIILVIILIMLFNFLFDIYNIEKKNEFSKLFQLLTTFSQATTTFI
jgi:hypothetical protein